MRVLIAFDKFKDAITAHEACEVAARALRYVQPGWKLDLCPLTDGGDGFEEIVRGSVGARRIEVAVEGPRGVLIAAGFSLAPLSRFPQSARAELLGIANLSTEAPIAIIEMARASGLSLLRPEQRDPWQTTTYGTGQLIRAAATAGAQAIVLGIGGSATNDLGLGALNALGVEFHDATGKNISPPTPRHWEAITTIAGDIFPRIPPLLIASDVINPLLGPSGAAATYGEQKGLRPESLSSLEAASVRIAQLLCTHWGKPFRLVEEPGTGAAGGIALGLLCALETHLRPALPFVGACLDLPRRLHEADVIITGEGRFDETSLAGKGPGALAREAIVMGKRVHVFAGRISVGAFDNLSLHEISPEGLNHRAMVEGTSFNLARSIEIVFN